MTIQQIAQACGFFDADYFRRCIQTPPAAYRSLFARVKVNTW